MPVEMKCPNPDCNFPGPLGFSEPAPWGIHFYHSGCSGAWSYQDQWYPTQAEAWKAYRKDNSGLDEDWLAAYDALLVRNDLEAYEKHIQAWRDKHC